MLEYLKKKWDDFSTEMEIEAAKDKLWEMGYPFGMESVIKREGQKLIKDGTIRSFNDIKTWEEGVVLKASMRVYSYQDEEETVELSFDYTRDV